MEPPCPSVQPDVTQSGIASYPPRLLQVARKCGKSKYPPAKPEALICEPLEAAFTEPSAPWPLKGAIQVAFDLFDGLQLPGGVYILE